MDKNVRIYWNLHKGQWSIQDKKSGLVVGRQPEVFLEGAYFEPTYDKRGRHIEPKFKVRQGGRMRVIKEGKKNVHAFAEGWYPSTWISPKHYHDEGREVTYNPYKNDTFVYKDTGEPVGQVGQIWLTTTAEGKPSVKVYS